MPEEQQSRASSTSFGRLCERFSVGCSCVMMAALVLTAIGTESPENRGEVLSLALFVLTVPAILSASFAITLRGIRRSWLAWVSMVPFVAAVILAYAHAFQLHF